jgi:hypothetical protein
MTEPQAVEAEAPKTMKVVRVVTSCRGCPHRQYYSAGRYECYGMFNGTRGSERLLPEGHSKDAPIPDWCPLEDYPRLLAERARMDAVEGWQDIASAPRDGDSFLACTATHADGCHEVIWWDDKPTDPTFPWGSEGANFHKNRFTHWMPLPKAPSPPESPAS